MKKNYTFIFLCFLLSSLAIAQNPEIIWEEDFESYQNLYGIEGSNTGTVNIGGYDPSTFTKWQLDDNSANLENFSDYVAINSTTAYPDKHLRAQDTDTGVDWITENIDISGHNEVAISMFISEVGNHEDSEIPGGDWIDVHYSFDDGASYTRLSNWNNFGNANHTLTGDTSQGAGCINSDFGNTRVFFTVPNTENTLKLKVTFKNGHVTENFILDDVLVSGINNSLSITDTTVENAIVYPNPANNVVNIKLKNSNIENVDVYDINQRLIQKKQNISSKAYALNVSNLKSGIYFLKITDQNTIGRTYKLIIK